MLNLKSKYSITNTLPLPIYIRHKFEEVYNFIPNALSKPISCQNQFVVIVGCGHSGTTLLSGKLSRHPEVLAIGRETAIFSPPVNHRCVKRIVAEWDYMATHFAKKVIIEKTPKHIHSIKKIHKIVPNTFSIVTIRNPLDNIASLHLRFQDLELATNRWLVDNANVPAILRSPNVITVRFEKLTKEPESEFRRICHFTGVSFEKAMLYAGSTSWDPIADVKKGSNMATRATQVEKPINERVDTWKEILTTKEALDIESKTKKIAQALGY